MDGRSKPSSVILMAAMAAMSGLSAGLSALEIKTSGAPRLPMRFRFDGGAVPTMHGHGRRNRPSGAPRGTYWTGDGATPERETRQMRRARERAERNG